MTMTVDRDALLAAIRESPADDLPRLAFADWCEENGDPGRAEFIRAQIRHEALGRMTGDEPDYDPDEWGRVIDAECKYDYERGVWWVESFAPELPPLSIRFSYRRGFVEVVSGPLDVLLASGGAILAAHPVTRMEVSDRVPLSPPGMHADGSCWWRFPDLPGEVFDALIGDKRSWQTHPVRVSQVYPSFALAHDALSAALLSLLGVRDTIPTPAPSEQS